MQTKRPEEAKFAALFACKEATEGNWRWFLECVRERAEQEAEQRIREGSLAAKAIREVTKARGGSRLRKEGVAERARGVHEARGHSFPASGEAGLRGAWAVAASGDQKDQDESPRTRIAASWGDQGEQASGARRNQSGIKMTTCGELSG